MPRPAVNDGGGGAELAASGERGRARRDGPSGLRPLQGALLCRTSRDGVAGCGCFSCCCCCFTRLPLPDTWKLSSDWRDSILARILVFVMPIESRKLRESRQASKEGGTQRAHEVDNTAKSLGRCSKTHSRERGNVRPARGQ
jgi:hypothetical protein